LTALHGGRPYSMSFAWNDMDVICDYVQTQHNAGAQGIYGRMTTVSARSSETKRGGADDSVEAIGLWADVDYQGPGHKTTSGTLPPDERSARQIIDSSALPDPTLWIHSGGGLYPLWLLSKPAPVTDPDVRQYVADLSARWQATIGDHAQTLGWHYGAGVGDLARVLRIPGTVNRKIPGVPVMARMLGEPSGRRYGLSDLASAVPDAPTPARPPERHTEPLRDPSSPSPLDASRRQSTGQRSSNPSDGDCIPIGTAPQPDIGHAPEKPYGTDTRRQQAKIPTVIGCIASLTPEDCP